MGMPAIEDWGPLTVAELFAGTCDRSGAKALQLIRPEQDSNLGLLLKRGAPLVVTARYCAGDVGGGHYHPATRAR
jgi:hypothetical protein